MRWSYTVMLGEVGYSGPLVGWLRLPAKAELRQWPELSMAAPAGRFLAEAARHAHPAGKESASCRPMKLSSFVIFVCTAR